LGRETLSGAPDERSSVACRNRTLAATIAKFCSAVSLRCRPATTPSQHVDSCVLRDAGDRHCRPERPRSRRPSPAHALGVAL